MVDYVQTTLDKVKELIDSSIPLMFDTETVGFYGKIRLAQFFQEGWAVVMLVEWPNPMELAAMLTDAHVVMHNGHYDITTIQEQMGHIKWMPKKFDDTFLLARLYFPEKECFALDEAVSYVIGSNPYEGEDHQKSDWGAIVLSEEQKQYAAKDALYMLGLWSVVKACQDDFSYKLDMLTTRYCLDFQNNGMPIDMSKVTERYKANNDRLKEINLPINCNSFAQVRKYISSNLSDDEGLARLTAEGNERAKAVREARKLIKNNSFLTKFVNAFEEFMPGFGYIYGKFKCSARSGRTTSNDQNLQQIPRSLKGIFGVKEDGDIVIILSDFAQAQLRAVCAKTGDKAMEKLFREGKDLHNYVTEIIFGPNYTKEHRQICKTANFGLLFGAGVVVFIAILLKQSGLYLTEAAATGIKSKWNKLWVEITAWQKQGIKDWNSGKLWETPLGRKYKAKMMTDQLAMQIQGFEAEVAKLAMHYMLTEFAKPKWSNYDIKLINFIHDSYMFTCVNDKEVYEEACKVIANSMQEAWVQMCQELVIKDLPMPVKVQVGFNWGDMESGKFIFEHKQ